METVHPAHPQMVDVADSVALHEENTPHVKVDAVMADMQAVAEIGVTTSRDVQAMVVTDLATQTEEIEATTPEIEEAEATTEVTEEVMVVDGHSRTMHSSRTR